MTGDSMDGRATAAIKVKAVLGTGSDDAGRDRGWSKGAGTRTAFSAVWGQSTLHCPVCGGCTLIHVVGEIEEVLWT